MDVDRSPYDIDRTGARRLVGEHYPEIAPSLLEPLFDVLRVGRQACDGDTEKALIILVVAIRTAYHPDFAAIAPEKLRSGEIEAMPSLGTNVRSIAESLGVPRETVRRKVRELVAAGWIEQQGRELRYTAHAAQRMSDVRNLIEQMAVKNFETVSALLQRCDGRR